MSSDPVAFKGIILRTSEYKEKDRLIKVLTKGEGILDICVKGVSGKTSKFSFASVPYSYCDFVVTNNHGFWYLKDGNVISGNTGIMGSLEAIAVAGHMSDCLLWSVMQSEDSSEAYELSIYAYYALSSDPASYLKILISFNWKLMCILGLASNAKASVNTPLSSRHLSILDYIGANPVSKIFTIDLNEDDIRVLRSLTMDYLRIQFERDIPDPILKLNLPGNV